MGSCESDLHRLPSIGPETSNWVMSDYTARLPCYAKMPEYQLDPKFMYKSTPKTIKSATKPSQVLIAEVTLRAEDSSRSFHEEVIIVQESVGEGTPSSRPIRDDKDPRRIFNKSFTGLDRDVVMIEYKTSSKMNSDVLYRDLDESDSVLHSPHVLSVNKETELAALKNLPNKLHKRATCL